MKPILHRSCYLFFLLFFSAALQAQEFSFRNGFGQSNTLGLNDEGHAVCTDAVGNVYLTGKISDGQVGNTVSFGGAALVSAGDDDGFVAKFSSSGTHLWSIRFGGAAFTDIGLGIATNGTSVFVTGVVNGSMTVGTSATAYPAVGSGEDGFVMSLNAGSGATNWVTRFGGASADQGQAICLDGSGNVYVSGVFRTRIGNATAIFGSAGAFDRTVNGNAAGYTSDLFVARVNPSTGAFVWVSTGGQSGSNDNISKSGICYAAVTNQIVVGGSFRSSTSVGTLTATYATTSPASSQTLTNSGNTINNEDLCILKLDPADGSFDFASGIGSNTGGEGVLGLTYDAVTQQVFFCGFFASQSFTVPGAGTLTNGWTTSRRSNIFYASFNPSTNTYGWAKGVTNSAPDAAVDQGWGIATNGLGDIYVTGQFANTATFPNGGAGLTATAATTTAADIFLVRVNGTTGNAMWLRQGQGNDGSGSDIGFGIATAGLEVWQTGVFYSTLTLSPLTPLNSIGNGDILLARLTDQAQIISVTVPANGTYKLGDQLNFTVSFNTPVAVNTAGGTPSISVTVGATARTANYVSGSGTASLVFRYTVQAGDLDNNGIALGNSLSLNGGTVRNNGTTINALLGLSGVAATTGVLVDGVVPVVSTINREFPVANPTNNTSVTYRVSFGEAVNGVDINDFALTTTGTASGTVLARNVISTSVYDIIVSNVTGNGTLRLDLKSTGTGITDLAGNAIATGYTSGQTYTIDNLTQSPTLTSPADNSVNPSPVTVTATLPETPLASSVQLVFTGGSTVTLTLVNATSYNFTFDVNNLSASPQIAAASSATLPPGTYAVTLRYQDALGNPQATAVRSNVRVSFALPAKLGEFTALAQGRTVKLQWTTLLEENTEAFIIEHSIDGNTYQPIGTVAARNTGTATQAYQYEHGAASGLQYYRLRIKDLDGRFVYSPVRTVLLRQSTSITISPNPVADVLMVEHSLPDLKELRVVDNSGRLHLRQRPTAGNGWERISLATLPVGVYYLSLVHSGGVEMVRFVKM
jgi:hypothetical protein